MSAPTAPAASVLPFAPGSLSGILCDKIHQISLIAAALFIFAFGPGRTILISSLLYVIATFLFSRLPDAALPGSRRIRKENPKELIADNSDIHQYLRGLYDDFAYCLTHASVLGLIFFEAMFWIVASVFYVLVLFHAQHVLRLNVNDESRFFSRALACTGIGLLGGALGMAAICRKVSPIMTYTPAFMLISLSLFAVFHSTPESARSMVDGVMTNVNHAPGWVYPIMFALGLGAGFVLGRVDADVLAAVDSAIRGRVLCLKAVVFAATLLGMLLAITEAGLGEACIQEIILWMPRLLCLSLPLVFVLSWMVDIPIYTKKGVGEIREFPGPLHRAGYRLLRALARVILKAFFRYEPIDARNVPETGGVVLAANHASFLDPLLMGCGTGRVIQYVIYSSYYRSFAHPLFRFLRCIPMDESDQLGALKTGVRSLKLGACIGIFPEGKVSADGKLSPPMRGALFLAQQSGAAVVPVALKGNYGALPRGAWIPRAVKVTPIYGKPFALAKDLSRKGSAELTDQLMAGLALKLELEPPPKTAESVEKEE